MISLIPRPAPYERLHIYYFIGRVPEAAVCGAAHFIGNWEEDGESFLFFHQAVEDFIADLVNRLPFLELVDCYQMTYEQWQGAEIVPFQVGRLEIVPAWYTILGPPSPCCLRLDPGVVLAPDRSHHPALPGGDAKIFDCRTITRVLDLGTGSGLLALAAVALGARQVLAVDLNFLAARTARHNAAGNRMAQRILVVRGNATNFMDLSCELMVSNIHFDVMRRLIETPGFQRPKHFILSGLLRSQARDIASRLERMSAVVTDQWEQDAVWFTLAGYTSGRADQDADAAPECNNQRQQPNTA